MSKTFRPYSIDQQILLPQDLRSWLPDGHLAVFVSDIVDELDLSAIFDAYEQGDGRGQPPYHPLMMVKLLVYGYCVGVTSSRKIERATHEGVAFRARGVGRPLRERSDRRPGWQPASRPRQHCRVPEAHSWCRPSAARTLRPAPLQPWRGCSSRC